MRRVTKENLIIQIDRLYKIKDDQCQLSMNDEYNLQVYKMLLATMNSEPVVFHMGEAFDVFNALKVEQVSERVNNAGLGPMGASEVQVWTSKAGGRLEFISANGGCTLNIFPQPAPVPPGNSITVIVSQADIFNVEEGRTYAGGEMIAVDTIRNYLSEHNINLNVE